MTPYVFQAFPKWKYRDAHGVIVTNPQEEAELGPGWGDSPGFTYTPEIPADKMPELKPSGIVAVSRAELYAEAERRGIRIDKRWATVRIQQALDSGDCNGNEEV